MLNSAQENWLETAIPIRARWGICCYSNASNMTAMLHKSDNALYLAKIYRKNQSKKVSIFSLSKV